ncbi:hypothetical protein ACEWY4_025463 [Coilia grayii]|uniref:Alkylated DNA repair protein AlkB homologue 8 N-terminal domain-containing protein n=1 Tax=Coilia grayii TaxID=363190 RepID=A0ABD1IYL6_9TELE
MSLGFESLRFLRVHISQDLYWSTNTSAVAKKGTQRLHSLRILKKAQLPSTIGKLFGELWSEVGARVETEAMERKRGPGLGWAELTCVEKGGGLWRGTLARKKEAGAGHLTSQWTLVLAAKLQESFIT